MMVLWKTLNIHGSIAQNVFIVEKGSSDSAQFIQCVDGSSLASPWKPSFVTFIFKSVVQPKKKFCHYLFTFMSLQTCISFSCETQEEHLGSNNIWFDNFYIQYMNKNRDFFHNIWFRMT